MELEFDSSVKEQEKFSLNYQKEVLTVRRLYISNQVIFHIDFSSLKSPLTLTRATDHAGYRFWTSIPQGRQVEAEEIGPLIANYILSIQLK